MCILTSASGGQNWPLPPLTSLNEALLWAAVEGLRPGLEDWQEMYAELKNEYLHTITSTYDLFM